MKVAVLGCGYWGKNLVRNFAAIGALGAVVDPTESGRARAKELAPGIPVFDSSAQVLADSDITGVVIATPAETHYALSRQALEANKDVMCEKPLALRYRDAVELAALAKQRERILMVGHILEYHPAILKLRELIDQGELGDVRYLYSRRLNLGKVRQEENILWSFAPHDIAVILRIMGTMPFRVISAGGAYVQPNIADVTMTQLLFDDNCGAHIFVSWLNPFKEQRLVVVGERKMATFDDVNKELVVYDQRVDVLDGAPVPVKHAGDRVEYSADEPLRLECQAFVDSMRTRRQPVSDATSALQVLRVLEAAQRSLILQGEPITMPLE